MTCLLLVLQGNDASYMQGITHVYKYFNAVHSTARRFSTYTEFVMHCRNLGVTHVATTRSNGVLFKVPLQGTGDDNNGYVWERDGIKFVKIPDLEKCYSIPYMRFLQDTYFRKLIAPEEFLSKDTFSWTLLDSATFPVWLELLSKAQFIAVDIETSKDGLRITSCSYTGMFNGRTKTCVIPFGKNDNYMQGILMARALNALPVPKVLQNGQYDISYFMRFGCPLSHYFWDTYALQHCIYSELPADLAFLSGMYILNFKYWKDESSSNLYEYNAKDTHNTAWLLYAMLKHIKLVGAEYALRNYLIEFPLQFPCVTVGLEGIAVDETKRLELRAREVVKVDRSLAQLRHWLGCNYNPGSPQQTLALMRGLGFTKAQSSDKKNLQAFSEAHPLYGRIQEAIVEYRKASKAINQYYDMDLLHGRMLYQQDPAGTDTGRLASKASNFWCGTQIQNIPAYSKGMFVADDGYLFAEVDNSQSESRCTAYISQDLNLIDTVENSPDFHKTNACLFFGLEFNQITKAIRTVAKRINHGANYNMGAQVLLETMGTREVINAGRLLGLPVTWSLIAICKYLLQCFDRAYPKIKGEWYASVVREVLTTGRLVGATGWTRRTFLRPDKDKRQLNSCVAHPPQSLSVMLVNQAFLEVWKMQFFGEHAGKFRLKAQIHDSIFIQYKIGCEYIVDEIARIMRSKDCVLHGRLMVIPNDPKLGGKYWGDLKE